MARHGQCVIQYGSMPTVTNNNVPEVSSSLESVFKVPEVSVEVNPELGVETESSSTIKEEQPQPDLDVQAPVVEQRVVSKVPITVSSKDPGLVAVEDILAEDLTDVFLALPADKKLLFKQKGEEVAKKIIQMAESGRVKIQKILDLVREWLKLIPGVNKFFLEQEAKIKSDSILLYVESRNSGSQNAL